MLAAPRLSVIALAGTCVLTSIGVATSAAPPTRPATARVPVLVELFTSEGCSSCPPADALLRDLLATQPVEGAQVIGLSEHVDYWNRLGWADPFSNAVFSSRQSDYAFAASSSDVYTPQMVVDGGVSFVGSDRTRALAEIAAAASRSKATIALRWTDNGDIDVRLEAGVVSPNTPVWISIAEDGLVVRVRKGENANRTLTHDAVTRQLTQIGRTGRSGAFSQTTPIRLSEGWRADATHVIGFTQQPGGPVTALGTIRLSDRPTRRKVRP